MVKTLSIYIEENDFLKEAMEEVNLNKSKYYASDIMEYLDIDFTTFEQALFKAQKTCLSLNIPIKYHFKSVYRSMDTGVIQDLKLSPVAAYLITINADPENPKVARLQFYFASKYHL